MASKTITARTASAGTVTLEIDQEALLKALFPTPEEREKFAREYFTERRATLSVDEACEYLGVKRTKLFGSQVPFVVIGGHRRYTRTDLDSYIAGLPRRTSAFRARIVRLKTMSANQEPPA